ncbi:MAG: FtsW/RodA/SpoVE family cell cycle protein, partial [Anaerolineae bacterium]
MAASPVYGNMNGRPERRLLLLTTVFVFINAVSLSLVTAGHVTIKHLWGPVIWLILFTAAHWLLNRYRPRRDPLLLPVVALLSGWGIILIDRLAPNFLTRQVIWLGLGTAVLLTIAILPRNLDWLRRYRYTLLVSGLLLLAGTLLFGVNPSGFGDALWLPLPLPFHVFFQPSELLKLLLVIFLASYFDHREPYLQLARSSSRLGAFPLIAPLLIMWGLCILFLVWQQDLGAATLFFILFLAILYLATGQWGYVWGGLVLLLAAGVFGYAAFDRVTLRVNAWLNPWPDARNQAYQIVQSLYAIANGGILGQGIAQGFPDYIPVVHSDFAFAAIAEEWGLIGSLVLVSGFACLAYRGFRLAAQAVRPFTLYLAAGISILFSAQALLIMGGATRLLPLTGVTLPFVSYGGSSLLVSCIMIGLLIYLSSRTETVVISPPPARDRLPVVMGLMLVGFTAVVLVLGYWSIGRAPAILAREDNPRLVEAELRIQRGRIFDRNNLALADTIGRPDELVRRYPLTAVGPAIGYYSFRHGASGIEESMNAILRGNSSNDWEKFTRQLLHQNQIGRDIRLTLDASKQIQAEELLMGHRGAIVGLELSKSGLANILMLMSHPSYDPNTLDENF